MAVNVSGTVQVGGVNVSAQVETHGVNATATVQRSNTAVSASVEHRSANVSATAQTRNTNVCASVNPHIMPGGTSDHAQLHNLDYDNAGHTGFQRELIPDESITIDEEGHIHANGESYTAGQNISIDENNVISAVDTTYTQGNGITIDQENVISNDIYPLVPAQATSSNQLADKDFVNSSIATSTATFRGTYNVVTDLHLSTSATHQQVATELGNTISVADNNDYCFVEIPTDDLTPTETLQVDRYKYNGSSWSFEYTLNNSGYTSAQWKAINSGITSGKVTQYDDYATSKQDTLIAGNNITIDVDGKTINSDIPQATSSVYGKVLLGAAGGAATYESVGDGKPICYPTTASDVKTTSMLVKSSVSDNGKILTENGFVYNTSGNPTVSDTKVICDLGVGFFEKKLENLTMNTEYHIKSYGQNASGLVYGSELVQMTPLNMHTEDMQLWLTADNVMKNANNLVEKWYDTSVNDYLIQQSNNNNKPLYVESAINGLPALQFNGTTNFLYGGNILNIGSKGWSYFIVTKPYSTDTTNWFVCKGDRNNGWNSTGYNWFLGNISMLLMPTPSFTLNFGASANQYSIFCFELYDRERLNSYCYLNNILKRSVGVSNVNAVNTYNFEIGKGHASQNGYQFYSGEIAEIIIYDNISNDIRNDINSYLSGKYNIQLG